MPLAKGTIVVHDGTGKLLPITPGTSDSMLLSLDTSKPGNLRWSIAPKYFVAYDAVGNINISGGFTPITWDTEIRKDELFTHTADSSDIATTHTGNISISVDVSTKVTSGNSRSASMVRILKNTGSGFAELSGSRGFMYNRNRSQGDGSTHIKISTFVNSGDQIRVEAQKKSGSNTIVTQANGCRIKIKTLLT